MQILKDLYQVGGDLNGITFDLQGALWNDENSYIPKKRGAKISMDIMLPRHGLIYFHKPQWRLEEVLNSALSNWR